MRILIDQEDTILEKRGRLTKDTVIRRQVPVGSGKDYVVLKLKGAEVILNMEEASILYGEVGYLL